MTPPPTPPPRPWSREAELLAIVGFWAMLGGLTLLRRALDPRGPAALLTPGVTLTLAEYALWAAATPAIFGLVRALPLERGVWVRRVALHLAIALAAAVLIEVFRFYVQQALVPPEWLRSERAARRMRRGGGPLAAYLRPRVLDGFVIYLGVLAAGLARDYFLRFRERQAEAIRLQAEAVQLQAQLAEARLSALRMQLNPHFLFNTLHAVSALVERDPAGVRTLVARLSDLLRHVLDGSPSQEVPLRDELALLRGYLDIQRVRFQGALEVEEDAGPETLDALVPNLVLQPLVENAVEHGVSRVEGGGGRVTIRARRETDPSGEDTLVLLVLDNGPGGPGGGGNEGGGGGVGLRNTRDRLRALYGGGASLRLRPGDAGGTVAEVRLPFHTPPPPPLP